MKTYRATASGAQNTSQKCPKIRNRSGFPHIEPLILRNRDRPSASLYWLTPGIKSSFFFEVIVKNHIFVVTTTNFRN